MPQHLDSLAQGSQDERNVVPLGAEQQVPVEDAWRLISRLMGHLELEPLIHAFFEETGRAFACAGVTYTPPEDGGQPVVAGEQTDCRARYGLNINGEDLGVVWLYGHRPMGAAELARAEQGIGLLVTPLRNALRHEAALCAARTDPLTGLLNRSTMHASLVREVGLARRYNESMCLLAMDLDDFKIVNDTFGHPAGDQALRDLADVLRRCCRESDLAFRVGGDEFVVALSHTNIAGAGLLAERLRRAVAARAFEYAGQPLPVQVSIGVTALQEHDSTDDLLRRVDDALLRAKGSGRNQVLYV